MKTVLFSLTAAAVLVLGNTAFAGVVLGCEVKPIENSNAMQLVDPNCSFNGSANWGGSNGFELIDSDEAPLADVGGMPETEDEKGYEDA